jgi:CBS domain-containing protein/anti-sigma regulatory factor (Ser/Thr protein kinase)
MQASGEQSFVPEITRLQELVYELRIEDVMTKKLVTTTPQTSMARFREILREHRISGTPVLQDGELVGVVSIEDLIEALAAGEMECTVGEKMTRNPVVLFSHEPLVQAVDRFNHHRYGRFPIVDKAGNLVGILTQGDIIRGLLKRLEVEHHEEEIRRYRASHVFEDVVSDRTCIMLHYLVKAQDFNHAGEASSKIKRALSRLGAPLQIVRRIAIAAYEAEMNIIIHAHTGGELSLEIWPERLIFQAIDTGPGIPDIELAMQAGFSTATETVRELGFGAGMGLPNIKRCADEMHLDSPASGGTHLTVIVRSNRIWMPGKSYGSKSPEQGIT